MGIHAGKISAGSQDLDYWLHGGYEPDIVTVIYGPPGSGKTNFCLLAAVSQAKKGNKVIFVDTEGGFSVERVKQIAGEETSDILENIFLLTPTNFTEQKQAFEKLLVYLKQEVGLIVVDGMTMLYRLDFASARGRGFEELQGVNSELAHQTRLLAEIARKRHIAILLTNQIYQWENASKMVGGDILCYWGKCLIELTLENSKRTAYLRKHRSLPEQRLAFQIKNEGITKRGWI